ncbi:MAG TPA: MFS transporter [Candidatus Lokiarchaeia archaeon]|nr:MFS transporter [Candidatus Lokiarchaeia archaeon]
MADAILFLIAGDLKKTPSLAGEKKAIKPKIPRVFFLLMSPPNGANGPIYFMATLGDINVSTLAFATAYLGTKVGTPFEVGLIGMAYGLMYCVSPAIMGKIGDRIGRRPAILTALIAFVCTNIYMLALMGAYTPWTIMLGNIFGGICWGCFWPNYIANVSEQSSVSANARVIANQNVAWSLGYMSGPLLTGILAMTSIFWAFAMMIACTTTQFCLALLYIPPKSKTNIPVEGLDTRKPASPADSVTPVASPAPVRNEFLEVISANPAWRIELLVVLPPVIFAFMNQLFYAIFPNYAILPVNSPMGQGLGWAAWLAGLAIFFIGIGRTTTFTLLTRSRRPDRTVSFSLLVAAIMLLITAFTRDPVLFMFIMVVYGLTTGYIYGLPQVITLLRSSEGKGGRAGLYESMVGFGFITAALFGGILANINLTWPYLMGAAVAGSAFIVIQLSAWVARSKKT